MRHDIWKQCKEFSNKPTGIYTLTVPTGGGKTLSSLRFALDHAILYRKKRILYILPFTTIIEQNVSVVRGVLNADDYLLEHHSNVVFEENNNDDFQYHQVLTERWTTPIIFTTMVQFLNTFFARGTQDIRRFHNLTDAIIIFDEIQALPTKCITLFNKAINFLSSQCRDTVLLCSATQPNLSRVKQSLNISSEIISDVINKFAEFKRMEIVDKTKPKMSIEDLCNFVIKIKKENKTILIILNTKNTAISVFKEVKAKLKDINLIYYFLSTNLCAAHRKNIIKQMKDDLEQHKQVICVSTQLIEAGVDISFSCVIRHIAGLDSIAQASGRGNRNGEGEVKNTYIIQLDNEKLGNLEEINLGETCTSFVLDDFRKNPANFNNDLLSPKAITRYYDYYFNDYEIENKMDYPVSGKINSIYKMLSTPEKRNKYEHSYNKKYPFVIEFQMRTAANSFQVIDEYAKSVLAPYGEGADFINHLLSQDNIYPDRKLFRIAQQYMVNISMQLFDLLIKKQAIVIDGRSGIAILDQRYYDEVLGVTTDGKNMDALFLGW